LRAIRLKESVAIDPTYLQANRTIREIITRHPNTASLNFEETGVFKKVPLLNGVPIYYDESHLNEEGVKRYATVALEKFKKIISSAHQRGEHD
jgi:hypothetical protein